jgi:hypothetical protein
VQFWLTYSFLRKILGAISLDAESADVLTRVVLNEHTRHPFRDHYRAQGCCGDVAEGKGNVNNADRSIGTNISAQTTGGENERWF